MDFNLVDFIMQDALVLVPVLIIIGAVLKSSPIENWIIPWVLLFFGIIFSIGYLGRSWESFFQGVIVFGVATGFYQLYKQTKESRG